MSAYYNEHDPFAAAWLRELIKEGLIADGEVDERDIQLVQPDDVRGFTQCHFFAGIGGWSLALRLAGWPDDRPVWTGSCPCQPFSAAGKRQGTQDVRHLWPTWATLIAQCRPVTIFGEQVESAIAHGWLDAVHDDLEGEGYACGAVCLPAASVGAPHLRQRLWFVADAESQHGRGTPRPRRRIESPDGESVGLVGHAESPDGQVPVCERRPQQAVPESGGASGSSELGHADATRSQGRVERRDGTDQCAVGPPGMAVELGDSNGQREDPTAGLSRRAESIGTGGAWANVEWLPCRDGKWRPTQPGLFPLAHGVSNRVGTLRGAGNAIVPQAAAEVVKAFMETR